jgi:DnaK suppressor protein
MAQNEVLARIRARLEQERASLQSDIATLQVDNQAAQDDEGAGNHIADEASEVFIRERNLALRENAQDLLTQVESAMQRLDAGSYGICARCGKPIPVERLEALPYAIYGVDCQAIIEQEARR